MGESSVGQSQGFHPWLLLQCLWRWSKWSLRAICAALPITFIQQSLDPHLHPELSLCVKTFNVGTNEPKVDGFHLIDLVVLRPQLFTSLVHYFLHADFNAFDVNS